MLRGDLDLASDEEYARLVDRRSSIVSSLRSVNGQIRKLGMKPMSQQSTALPDEDKEGSLRRRQLMATTPCGRLSWRGLELAHALFEAYEVKGRLNVGAYLSDLGRDEPAPCGGINEFVAYREEIEAHRPIEEDVLTVGLVARPFVLHRWKQYGRIFDSFENGGRVPVECFQQLCFESGVSAGSVLLKAHLDHNTVCSSVREEYARRHRVLGSAQTSRVKSDRQFLYRDAFLAFLFSGRPNKRDNFLLSSFVRFFCQMLRRSTDVASRALDTLSAIVARGLLPPERTGSAKTADAATLDVSILVGDGGGTTGAGIEVRYEALTDPTRFATEKQLPKNVGSCVLIDFEIRPGTERINIVRLKKHFVAVFKQYLENDLKRHLPGFLGIRLVHQEAIFRVQLLWRQDATLDKLFLKKNIHLRASDFVQQGRASLRFSMPLTELLQSRLEPLEFTASCKLSYARALISLLVEEVLFDRKEQKQREKMDSELKRAAYLKAVERTIASHGRIVGKNVDDLIGVTGYVEEFSEETIPVERHRNKQDAKAESQLWRFLRLLRGSKHLQFELAFEHIHELLFENATASTLIGRHQRRALKEALSNLARWWKRVTASLRAEIDELWSTVDRVEAAESKRHAARERAEKERLAEMSEIDRRRQAFADEKKTWLKEVKKSDDNDESLSAEAAAAADDVEEAKRVRSALSLYKLCRTALVGLRNATIQSSDVTVSIDFEGLDIFDNLP